PTAASLLGGSGGAPGAADPDASGAGAGAEPGSTAGVEALLAAMQPQAQPRRAGALAPPSFSAQPTLASGAQVPSGGGGGGAAPSGVDALLNAAAIVGQQPGGAAAPSGPASPSGPDAPSSGQVKGAKLGDPVVGGTSIGGEHETSGLSGYPARDYFAPAGSDAVAPVSGKVVKLSGHDPKDGPTNGPHGPLGWSVYVKGSDGKTYFLTHLGSRTVKVGERVDAGQEIGTVANYDKYGTPSHVHMGVRG
ncbi:MAG TPA: peptidoglycan DD-metalloendopeptidase family protein, partial [Baekduia sp.]